MHDSGRHWRDLLDTPTAARLALWYAALLVPTLFYKFAYLRALAGDGLSATLASNASASLPPVVQYLAIIGADLRETLVIVAAAYLIARIVRLDVAWAVAATLFAALAVSALNWVSFETAGVLATRDNVGLAVAWIRENPGIITAQRMDLLVAAAAALLVLLALLWSGAFFLLTRYAVTPRAAAGITRSVVSLVVLLGIGAVAARAVAPEHGVAPESARGYWSATAHSLFGSESWQPFAMRVPSVPRIDSEYEGLVYPDPAARDRRPRIAVAPGRARPAHVVIVSLETGARKYYDIVDNPAYPTFFEMGRRGLVSDHHYATMPATTWAIYSIVSGTYPRLGRSPVDYGDFATDGLAATLGREGYETTYIDSYRIDWNPSNGGHFNSRMLRGLGFAHLVEPPAGSRQAPDAGASNAPDAGASYTAAVAQEQASLSRAVDAVAAAQSHGTRAFVFVATLLGHYPWRTPPGAEGRSNAQKLAIIAHDLDGCLAEFLRALHARGVDSNVVVVVTGDHGLRTKFEFASLGESAGVGDLAFNVPLIIYAPGVFGSQVRIPYVTSHVDIAPTVLALVGADAANTIEEGSSMLDGGPCGRTTFLLNNTLRPVDGFYRGGRFFVLSRLTGDVRESPGPADPCTSTPSLTGPDVARVLSRAAALFDTTTAIFLQRRRGIPAA